VLASDFKRMQVYPKTVGKMVCVFGRQSPLGSASIVQYNKELPSLHAAQGKSLSHPNHLSGWIGNA